MTGTIAGYKADYIEFDGIVADPFCSPCTHCVNGECQEAFKGEVPGYQVDGKVVACARRIISPESEDNNE